MEEDVRNLLAGFSSSNLSYKSLWGQVYCDCVQPMYRPAMKLLHIILCLTVLVVETYSSISWTREISHRTKRQAQCKPDEFKCTSGECIYILSKCDGTKECADGSDETACIQLNTTDSPSPPKGSCLLPQPPEFGGYKSPVCTYDKTAAGCDSVPGTPVPQNWLLAFKCNEGYYIKETHDKNFYIICVDGKWSSKIPVCRNLDYEPADILNKISSGHHFIH